MRSTFCWRFVAPAVAILLLSAFTVEAQESRATLTGRVSDPAGAAIPNATVVIKNQQTSLETTITTGEEGNYTVTALLPGRYTVSVEAQGFKRAESDQVELFTASTATFDVTLEIGSFGETVIVNTEAPLLEPDTASRGQVVENERISELPLVGRNRLTSRRSRPA